MNDPCPKCNGSGFIGEIRGGGQTERVPCPDCWADPYQSLNRFLRFRSPQDSAATLDPPDTPAAPPAIEPAPNLAANPAILKVQRIAPDYTYELLTIRDEFGIERQIFVSTEEECHTEN